jgi:hypothetical protein
MIDLRFRLRTRDEGTVILEFGVAFRVLFAFLALILGMGIAQSGGFAPLPIGILVVLLVGALYEERWEFDPTEGTITTRHGLLVAARRRTWRFSEVSAVEYTHYRSGSVPGSHQAPPSESENVGEAMNRFGRLGRGLNRHFLRYGLVFHDGSRRRIELRRVRDWGEDKNIPATVAGTIGVPEEHTAI